MKMTPSPFNLLRGYLRNSAATCNILQQKNAHLDTISPVQLSWPGSGTCSSPLSRQEQWEGIWDSKGTEGVTLNP